MRHRNVCNKAPKFDRSSRIRGSGKVTRESPPDKAQFVCWIRYAISIRLRVNQNTRFVWGTDPIWGRYGASGSGVRPRESHPYRHNLFFGNETLYLSVYEPIAIGVLWGGGPSTNLWWRDVVSDVMDGERGRTPSLQRLFYGERRPPK